MPLARPWPPALALAALLTLALATAFACGGDDPPPDLGPGEVEFTTSDGVTLRGRHYGLAALTVVLAHMRPADQESWAPFAERLAEEGYAAFTFNFRGYPPSGGEVDLSTLDLDVLAALDYLDARGAGVQEAPRPVIIGASMGGTAAIAAAARREVAGIVALSAPAAIDGLSAEAAVGQVSAALYIMAAEGDETARTDGAALHSAARNPGAYEIWLGSEHGSDLVYGQNGALVQERILEFVEQFNP